MNEDVTPSVSQILSQSPDVAPSLPPSSEEVILDNPILYPEDPVKDEGPPDTSTPPLSIISHSTEEVTTGISQETVPEIGIQENEIPENANSEDKNDTPEIEEIIPEQTTVMKEDPTADNVENTTTPSSSVPRDQDKGGSSLDKDKGCIPKKKFIIE